MKRKVLINRLLYKSKILLLAMVISYLLVSILTSIIIYLQKVIIDVSLDVAFGDIVKIVFALIILSIIVQLLQKSSSVITYLFSSGITENFNSEVTKKLNTLSLETMEDKNNLDLIDRIQNMTSLLTENLFNSINLMSCIISFIGVAIVLSTVHWYFTCIVVVLSMPYFLLIRHQGFEQYRLEETTNTDTRKLLYLFDVLTVREYAKEVRTFKLREYLSDKYFELRQQLWVQKKALLIKYSIKTIFVTLLKNISLLVCLILTCYFIILGEETIGSLIMVISAVQNMMSQVNSIYTVIGKLHKQKFYLKDLDTFFNLEDEICGSDEIDSSIISFDNVSFHYPNSNRDALKDLSITINPCEKIAIVGENGSGKSTFVKLLLGIYKPTAGKIRIGNKSLNNVLKSFRKQSVCVFQDFIKYQYDIKDNINIGNWGIENEKFYNSKAMFMLDFTKKFPEDLNTILGRLDDSARDISGGEWQKIAMCRALCREKTSFLILDEPMSALDPLVEAELYSNFQELCGNRTAILISHRLSATKICDRIIVFHEGQIIEEGTHDELMIKKGKYYNMFTAQQRLYV